LDASLRPSVCLSRCARLDFAQDDGVLGRAGAREGRKFRERGVDLGGKLGIVGGPAGFAFVKLEIFWDFGPGPAGKPLKKVNLRN
jgi:hypothetical protein